MEVFSRVRGYYHLATETFTDSLAKKSQYDILRELGLRIKDAIHQGLGLDGEDEQCFKNCKMLLADDRERERKREELLCEKAKVAKALESLSVNNF